jgi:hypothetical protein
MALTSGRLPLFAAAIACATVAVTSVNDTIAQQQSQAATVALLDFRGSGVGRNAADFAALGAAIPHHLGFVLASNPNIRLVDRNRIQEIIREQDLGAAGRLDSSTMVRIGRILGARYIIDGSFIIQDNGQMAISTTSTNMETSQVGTPIQVRGRVDRVLDLLDSLAASMNRGLRFPAIPAGTPRPAQSSVAGVDQNRLILLEGAALKAEDRGDIRGAVELWRQVAAMSPQYEGAKVKLARLGGSGG